MSSSRPSPSFFFSTNFSNILPQHIKDTRGCNTLYHARRTNYFLLDYNAIVNYTNHQHFTIFTNRNYTFTSSLQHKSTSRKPNLNYILSKFLQHIFTNQHQPNHVSQKTFIPRDYVSKYFKRIRQLLSDKFTAITNRIRNDSVTIGKRTTTYIRFSFRKTIYYLGFFLPCHCLLPAACVLTANRWRCVNHFSEILPIHHPPRPTLTTSFKEYHHNILKQHVKDKTLLYRKSYRQGIIYEYSYVRNSRSIPGRPPYLKQFGTWIKFFNATKKQEIRRTRFCWTAFKNSFNHPSNALDRHDFRAVAHAYNKCNFARFKQISHLKNEDIPNFEGALKRPIDNILPWWHNRKKLKLTVEEAKRDYANHHPRFFLP